MADFFSIWNIDSIRWQRDDLTIIFHLSRLYIRTNDDDDESFNIFFMNEPKYLWSYMCNCTLPTCSNADFGSYVPSIVKWPIINNFRIVFLIRPFLSIYYKTDHRKVDIYRVMMPKMRWNSNIFIFHGYNYTI